MQDAIGSVQVAARAGEGEGIAIHCGKQLRGTVGSGKGGDVAAGGDLDGQSASLLSGSDTRGTSPARVVREAALRQV